MASPSSSSAAEEDPTPIRPPDRPDEQVMTKNDTPEQQAYQSMAASSSVTAVGQHQNPTSTVVPPVIENNSEQPVTVVSVTVVSGPEANDNSGEHMATQLLQNCLDIATSIVPETPMIVKHE